MKTKRNKLIVFINLVITIFFLAPVRKISLLNENYSTLSLDTRGYLYVLSLGIVIGLLLAYETLKNSNRLVSITIFLSLLIGVIVPHQVPYGIRGNIHLLFAYLGFAGLVICTILNCKIKKYRDIYLLFIFSAVLIYLKYGMVNALSEIIVMLGTLFVNLIIFIKKRHWCVFYYIFRFAASTTWFINTEVVTEPTPPGTGVMFSTIGSTSSNNTSPHNFCFISFQEIPTSITVCPCLK